MVISGYLTKNEVQCLHMNSEMMYICMCMLNGFAWLFCAEFQQHQKCFLKRMLVSDELVLLVPFLLISRPNRNMHPLCQVFCDVTRQAVQHSSFFLYFPFLAATDLTSSSTILPVFSFQLGIQDIYYYKFFFWKPGFIFQSSFRFTAKLNKKESSLLLPVPPPHY